MEQIKKINKLKLNQETLRSLTDVAESLDISHNTRCSVASLCGLPCTP